MRATRHAFEMRKKELDLFFEHLAKVEESTEFHMDFCNVLHSNALLMVYNLVEATVVGGMEEIYDSVKEHGYSYRLVNAKLQTVWFDFKFNDVYDTNAHHNSYKKKASQIIDAILDDQVIDLNRHAINAEGNLDAQIIRNICKAHGIVFVAPPESRGGAKIEEVKDLRNALAHGGRSFVECGRNFALPDLLEMTKEILFFLTGLLDGMSDFYDKQKWMSENGQAP